MLTESTTLTPTLCTVVGFLIGRRAHSVLSAAVLQLSAIKLADSATHDLEWGCYDCIHPLDRNFAVYDGIPAKLWLIGAYHGPAGF